VQGGSGGGDRSHAEGGLDVSGVIVNGDHRGSGKDQVAQMQDLIRSLLQHCRSGMTSAVTPVHHRPHRHGFGPAADVAQMARSAQRRG
jgi:hypothetical protein